MKRARVEELLNFEKLHVAVLGDVMLDEYLIGKAERISPEAPVPIVNLSEKTFKLGGAANVAMNTSSLGATTSLIGIIGKDSNGEKITELSKQADQLTAYLIEDSSRKTTCKTRVLAGSQQLLRIDSEDLYPAVEGIVKKVVQILNFCHHSNPIDIIIFQDYNKGFFSPEMIKALMQWSADNKVKTCLDPKTENIDLFRGVSIFKPNLKEMAKYLNEKIEINEGFLSKSSEKVFERINCEYFVLTLSSGGIWISNRIKNHLQPITSVKTIIDVSGAGDTVIALISLLIISGKASIKEICILSNYAGGAVCNVPGVGIITKNMVLMSI